MDMWAVMVLYVPPMSSSRLNPGLPSQHHLPCPCCTLPLLLPTHAPAVPPPPSSSQARCCSEAAPGQHLPCEGCRPAAAPAPATLAGHARDTQQQTCGSGCRSEGAVVHRTCGRVCTSQGLAVKDVWDRSQLPVGSAGRQALGWPGATLLPGWPHAAHLRLVRSCVTYIH